MTKMLNNIKARMPKLSKPSRKTTLISLSTVIVLAIVVVGILIGVKVINIDDIMHKKHHTTTTTTTTTTTQPPKHKSDSNTGAIVGGSVVGGLIVFGLIMYFVGPITLYRRQ